MPRKYRSRRHFNRDKYSIEQTTAITPQLSNWSVIDPIDELHQATKQWSIPILSPVDFEGMRKVKHITVSFSNNNQLDTVPFFYAIVYVPQGYDPQPILLPVLGGGSTMYQSNQFVMSSGVLDFNGGPLRVRSPLSRNLNSGDSIYLILATINVDSGAYLMAQISYAITLQ